MTGTSKTRGQAPGFTLIDIMITLLVMEMTARLRAVTSNRPIRRRFDCLAAGAFGTAATLEFWLEGTIHL